MGTWCVAKCKRERHTCLFFLFFFFEVQVNFKGLWPCYGVIACFGELLGKTVKFGVVGKRVSGCMWLTNRIFSYRL